MDNMLCGSGQPGFQIAVCVFVFLYMSPPEATNITGHIERIHKNIIKHIL